MPIKFCLNCSKHMPVYDCILGIAEVNRFWGPCSLLCISQGEIWHERAGLWCILALLWEAANLTKYLGACQAAIPTFIHQSWCCFIPNFYFYQYNMLPWKTSNLTAEQFKILAVLGTSASNIYCICELWSWRLQAHGGCSKSTPGLFRLMQEDRSWTKCWQYSW